MKQLVEAEDDVRVNGSVFFRDHRVRYSHVLQDAPLFCASPRYPQQETRNDLVEIRDLFAGRRLERANALLRQSLTRHVIFSVRQCIGNADRLFHADR